MTLATKLRLRGAQLGLVAAIALGSIQHPAAAQSPTAAQSPAAEAAFTIDDYFKLKRITQVALSPNGKTVAYVVHSGAMLPYFSDKRSTEEKRNVRTVYIQPVAAGRAATVVAAISDAQDLVWLPGSRELAFLSARNGTGQVFSYDTAGGQLRQLTESADPVLSFRFSPDGKSLAYVTRPTAPPSKNLYSQLLNGERGIVMNSDTLSVYDFVDPENHSEPRPMPTSLYISLRDAAPFAAQIPGDPGSTSADYHWSPDGHALSVTYLGNDIPPSLVGNSRTSLGVFDVGTRQFRVLGKAVEPQGKRSGTRYAGGEWLPNSRKLLVRRVTETDAWVSPDYPDWTLVDGAADLPSNPSSWHRVATYGFATVFYPVSETRVLVEKTHEGVHSLFRVTHDGVEPSDLVAGLDGSSSLVGLSDDLATAAFINESLTRPPELFVRQGSSKPRKLTDLNGEVARHVRHTAREVSWKSSDGVTVRGWLLEPAGRGKGPWPMITHVHGGPAFVFPNAFAPYFEYWPFPFEVQAAAGVAIFMPNYRGTETYGRSFADPKRADREPADDVITGVRQMIANGVADPRRLGITGHSHGAWLGPVVMTREKIFRASSFAEGCSNQVLMYSLMPGDLNRQVHDVVSGLGTSFWDDPRLYLEGSPDLFFKDVPTASLWEAGAQSEAVLMFSYPKAARHFGAPSEFVVYPKTTHNPNLPSVQRESAQRNRDWFAFWLNGEEHGGADKAEQYQRWKALRAGSRWAAEYATANR